MFLVQNDFRKKKERNNEADRDHLSRIEYAPRNDRWRHLVHTGVDIGSNAVRISCHAFPRRNQRHLECMACSYEDRATICRKKMRLRRRRFFHNSRCVTALKITFDFFRYHYFSSSFWISSLVFHICSNRGAVSERVLPVRLVYKEKIRIKFWLSNF